MNDELTLIEEGSLPSSWQIVSLGQFLRRKSKTLNPLKAPNQTWELYSVPSHETRKPEIVQSETIGSNKQFVDSGDVLLSKINPRLNRSWVVGDFSKHRKIASTEWIVFEETSEVLSEYLKYTLSDIRVRDYMSHNASGVGGSLTRVKPGLMSSIYLGLPPIEDQRSILRKIETLLSEVDKGIESLKTAREQLKIYRQAVLKHAFEGKLTAQWREENKDKLESPEQLLVRIQQERKDRYQKELRDWEVAVRARETSGKEGKKPGKPRKPKILSRPAREYIEQRCVLPESWIWSNIGELFEVFVGSTPSRKNNAFWGGDIPWVSSGEVAFCDIKGTREKITNLGYANTSTEVHPAGTVMLAMIGEGKTRGQAAILSTPAAHNQNTAAIPVSVSGCDSKYIYYFFLYQYEVTRRLGSGNNQKALNKERVSNMTLPLCSVSEQMVVVEEIEEKASVIEKNEQEIAVALVKSESLRQSVLKHAFSGKITSYSSEG